MPFNCCCPSNHLFIDPFWREPRPADRSSNISSSLPLLTGSRSGRLEPPSRIIDSEALWTESMKLLRKEWLETANKWPCRALSLLPGLWN